MDKVNEIAEAISGNFIKKTPQIEQNQKIVDKIREYLYKEPDRKQFFTLSGNPISDESWESNLKSYKMVKRSLERIVAEATGRSDTLKEGSQEIHSQPKVIDEK